MVQTLIHMLLIIVREWNALESAPMTWRICPVISGFALGQETY